MVTRCRTHLLLQLLRQLLLLLLPPPPTSSNHLHVSYFPTARPASCPWVPEACECCLPSLSSLCLSGGPSPSEYYFYSLSVCLSSGPSPCERRPSTPSTLYPSGSRSGPCECRLPLATVSLLVWMSEVSSEGRIRWCISCAR